MAELVATVVAEEAVRSSFEAFGRYISYTRKYKRNMHILEEERKKIEDFIVTVSGDVRTAKNNAEDIRQDVLGWLRKCEELKSQANEFLHDTRHFNVSCLCCSCPNLKSRYLASSEAAELTSMIILHREEWKFDKVGQEPQLQQLPLLSPGEFYGFGSRVVIMKEVMDGLKSDSISVIGLCGMGGIGKTTLVKEIAEEAKNEKIFDEVAFVVVSQDQNVKALQDQLASRLTLKSIANEMDKTGRAELIYKRLMDEEKKILLILDDMWKELNLRSVGIPVHGDRKGFKILLTSRSGDVCNDMKAQQRLEVEILSKEEAWNLFKMTAEISDECILQIAQEVSQECAGLPLAIVTVGKSLRNKKEHAFRDVLRKLRNPSRRNTSSIHSVLYSCIKSSYDYLESDEHRSILLICSIFPEDYEIHVEDLVRYARGLFDNFETMAEARDRVEAIVDELMKCYLLLLGERLNCVKLHDVVRDVCLSIASESGDVHISLKFDDLRKMTSGLNSQRLRILRLVNKEAFWKSGFYYGLKLEETSNEEMNYYEEMLELRVLEINHINSSLRSSLELMINLHTLSLDYCRLQGDLAGIGSLQLLRVLSFFHSTVEMFPMEITKLTNLQCLDLRFQLKHQTTIPLRILSRLEQLEELYLGDIVSADIESLKEVRSTLRKLNTIQFVVEDSSCLEYLLKNLNLSELIRFDIAQGGSMESEYQIKLNVLKLLGKNVHIDLNLLKAIMWRVNRFYYDGEGLTNVVDVLGQDGRFQNLTNLTLDNCDMKYLVDFTNHQAKVVFSKLETIKISSASQLEELVHGDHPLGTHSELHEMAQGNLNVIRPFQGPLGNLRRIVIRKCDKIKNLFSKSVVNCLGKLERIDIKSCPVFERIVRIHKDDEVDCSQVFEFPELVSLTLDELPGFRSLMAGFNQVMLPKLELLYISLNDSVEERGVQADEQEVCFSIGSSLPKVRELRIGECHNLITIAKSGLVHGLQDLVMLSVFSCLSVEVVFDFEEIMGHLSAETEEITLLGRLESLGLYFLPKLKHIWSMFPPKGTPVFPNLKNIQVVGCGSSLRYLLTPTITNMLVHLEEIVLKDNELMEAIVGEDINMPNDGGEILLERLMLPKLKSLVLQSLPSFEMLCVCSPEITLELPCLTSLSIGRIGNRRYLLAPSSAELLLSVRELELCYEEQIEAILGSDEPDGEDATKRSIAFPELQNLKINNVDNFRKLCFSPELNLELPSLTKLKIIKSPVDILTRETRALQNLTKIQVEKCGSIKYLLTSSAGDLVQLEELVLRENESMEAIFGTESLDLEEIPNKTIVLPNLRKLEIKQLPNFRMLCCSLNLNVDLPSLTLLRILGCPKMRKLCAGQLSAPQLKNVNYGEMGTEVALGTFINSWLKDCQSMTRCLDCTYSGYETCHHLEHQNLESEEEPPCTESQNDSDFDYQNSE